MTHLLEYCGPFYSFCGNRWRGRYQELVLTGCCIPHAVNVIDMKCNKLFIRYSWGVVVLFIISCKFFEYYNSIHVRLFSLFKPLIQKQPKNVWYFDFIINQIEKQPYIMFSLDRDHVTWVWNIKHVSNETMYVKWNIFK